MSLNVRDFIMFNLEEEDKAVRRSIRQLKNHIKLLDSLKEEVRKKSKEDILKLLEQDPELLEEYNQLSEKLKEKERSEIKRMLKEGKLKEVFYDKNGREIQIENKEHNSESEQPSDGNVDEGRSSDGGSGGYEAVP